MMSELFKKIGVTHLYSTPYHPMTNGQIERYNATMDSKIPALSNDNRTNWDEQLPFVTFNYNTSIHATTGQIPYELMHGRSPILPFDQQTPTITLSQDPEHIPKLEQHVSTLTGQARNNIRQQQTKYKQYYDRHRSNPLYKGGDLVLIKVLNRRNKFDIRHEGPFRVIQQLGWKTYIVKHVQQPTIVRQMSNFHRLRERSSTFNHHDRYYYVSPLEKLDRISKRFTPKKVDKNNELKELCENGKCTKFEPSTFKYFYINETTPDDILNDLIDYAHHIKCYTIDTEDQMKGPGIPSDPALIQIEFIHEQDPSIIILIETLHLPSESSFKFIKIKELYTIYDEEMCEDGQIMGDEQNEEVLELFPVHYIDYELEIHEQDQNLGTDDELEQKSSINNEQEGVHVSDEPAELININDSDDDSLPDAMKLHFPSPRVVHVSNELQEKINNYKPSQTMNNKYQYEPLTKNQKKNQKRYNRYRFEVIRYLYKRFTINDVKTILTQMNILW
ncbi:unnamed protein product, partial [Didymodactylos carnosus]